MSITVALLLTACAFVSAEQDVIAPEELLSWFPAGLYDRVTHSDDAAIAAAEAHPLFAKYFDQISRHFTHGDLPPALQEGIRSTTTASMLRNRVSTKEEGESGGEDKEKKPSRSRQGGATFAANIGGERVEITSAGARLYVYRYDDLDSLVTSALESGEISAMDEQALERPILSFAAKNLAGAPSDYVGWASPTQELLVAEDVDLLRSMIAAGTGREMDMLSEPSNADLLVLLEDLGQRWDIHNFIGKIELMARVAEKRGADEERVSQLEALADTAMRYHATAWEVGESVVERTVIVCGSEERAKGMAEAQVRPPVFKEGTPQETIDYYARKLAATELSLDGSTAIITTTYDEKLLEALEKHGAAGKAQPQTKPQ